MLPKWVVRTTNALTAVTTFLYNFSSLVHSFLNDSMIRPAFAINKIENIEFEQIEKD